MRNFSQDQTSFKEGQERSQTLTEFYGGETQCGPETNQDQ